VVVATVHHRRARDPTRSDIVWIEDLDRPAVGTRIRGATRDHDAAIGQEHVEAGQVTVRDLGSHNGTHVNGSRIDGERRVVAGVVVSIGEVVLVVHADQTSAPRVVLDAAAFRQRLEDELDRASSYER
jgi:hypothetical protein